MTMAQFIGFKFHPRPEELVGFYLKRKHRRELIPWDLIREADVYGDHPDNITARFPMTNRGGEWFFFTHASPRLGTSKRGRRSAGPGRWKSTQATENVLGHDGRTVIGSRQSFCYENRTPNGGYVKTNWLMEEYSGTEEEEEGFQRKDASERPWVVCKIYLNGKARPKASSALAAETMLPCKRNTMDEEEEETAVARHPSIPDVEEHPSLVDIPTDQPDRSAGDGRGKRRRMMEGTNVVGVEDQDPGTTALLPAVQRSGMGEGYLAAQPEDTCPPTEFNMDYNFLEGLLVDTLPESGELSMIYLQPAASPPPPLLTNASSGILLNSEATACSPFDELSRIFTMPV